MVLPQALKFPFSNKHIFFDSNFFFRNRFLTSNRLKVLVDIYVKDSIDIIKFCGRQHASLIDIIDQLNVCYAFQVRYILVIFTVSMQFHFNTNFSEQILNSTAATFTYALSTIYGYCHIGSLDAGSQSTMYTRLGWLLLYLSVTLIFIYYSSLLTNEVKFQNNFTFDKNCIKNTFHFAHNFGRRKNSEMAIERAPILYRYIFVLARKRLTKANFYRYKIGDRSAGTHFVLV